MYKVIAIKLILEDIEQSFIVLLKVSGPSL